MADPSFALACEGLPEGTVVLAFRGVEGISEPYHFEVDLLLETPNAHFWLDDLVGERATLQIDVPDADPFRFTGLVSAAAHHQQTDQSLVFQLEITPAFAQLQHSRHSRVFTDRSVKAIIAEVFELAGLGDVRFDLDEGPELPFVCQYAESDFQFVSRWMERVGYWYYFEHGDHGEVLVITDGTVDAGPSRTLPVPYRPGATRDTSAGQAFSALAAASRLVSAKVAFTDYDDTAPKRGIRGEGSLDQGRGGTRVYHGDNAKGDAEARAGTRAEALEAARVRVRGHGQITHLRSGYGFTVVDHPTDKYNADFTAVRVSHYGNATGGGDYADLLDVPFAAPYCVDVESIFSEVRYRSQATTPWPRVYATELAQIDGPSDASDYAQLDPAGRYKVRFLFDEQSHDGGSASAWVRMAQPYAGNPEGFHFPLRKGTEVMITFLGGDPDQPVISGALPNAETPSPSTSSNPEQNVIVTAAENKLVMNDTRGEESIDLSTPKESSSLHMGNPDGEGYNEHLRTEGDARHYVGGDFEEKVKGDVEEFYEGDQTTKIDGSLTETIGYDVATNIRGAASVNIGSNNASVTMGNAATLTVGNFLSTNLANTVSFTAGLSMSKFVGDSISEFMGNQMSRTMGNSQSETMGNQMSRTMGNSTSEVIGNSKSIVTGTSDSLTLGSMTKSFTVGIDSSAYVGLKESLFVGGTRDVALAAKLGLDIAGGIFISASARLKVDAAIGVDITAMRVHEEPLGKSTKTVELKEGTVTIDGKDYQIKNGKLIMDG